MSRTEILMDALKRVVSKADSDILQNTPEAAWRKYWYLENVVTRRLDEVLSEKTREIAKLHQYEPVMQENVSNDRATKFVIHYTSVDTLLAILRERAKGQESYLRMYDSFHLNDPEEGRYLVPFLKVSDKFSWLTSEPISHAYVASFIIPKNSTSTELGDEDELAYWHSYGHKGKGCSIKIPVRNNQFRRVLYGECHATRTAELLNLEGILDCVDPLMTSKDDELRRLAQRTIPPAISRNLARINFLYKRKAHEYERECRLVRSALDISDTEEIHFQPVERNDSSHRIRHYYNDDNLKVDNILSTDSVITLGPLVPQPTSMMFYIETLLKKADLIEGPTIQTSKIPYQEG